MSSHVRAFKFLGVTLLVGGLLAWAGSWQGASVNGWPVFALCVLAAFAIQWLIFIPAYIWQTEKYFDLTGSCTYLAVMALALVLSGKTDARGIGRINTPVIFPIYNKKQGGLSSCENTAIHSVLRWQGRIGLTSLCPCC